MGTYTTNYNLFMPTIGEQGWGELVNGNFTTIDATMKGFDDVLSKMTWDGDNVTFPGIVTANGGIVIPIKIETENVNDVNAYFTLEDYTITNSGISFTIMTIPTVPENVGLLRVGDITGLNLTLNLTAYDSITNTTQQYAKSSEIVFYANNVEFGRLVSNPNKDAYNTTPASGSFILFVDGYEDIIITAKGISGHTNSWVYNSAYKMNSYVTVKGFKLGIGLLN